MAKSDVLSIARMLSSIHFIVSSILKSTHWSWTLADFNGRGVPFAVEVAAIGLICEFSGGLLLLLGLWTRFTSVCLLLFILVVNLVFHQFWHAPTNGSLTPYVNFSKDVAVIAGLLLFATLGAGKWSIDEYISRLHNKREVDSP